MPRKFLQSLRVKRDIIPRDDLVLDEGLEVWGNFPDDFPPVLAANTIAGPYNQRLQRGDRVANTFTRQASPGTFKADQVLVLAAGTLIIAANADRISCVIKNPGTVTVFLGTTNPPDVNHSHYLSAGDSFSFSYNGPMYGAVVSGSQNVSYAEESL